MPRIRRLNRVVAPPPAAPAARPNSALRAPDAFDSIPAPRSHKSATLARDPKDGAKFVEQFNEQLGLSKDALKGKIAKLESDPLKFLRGIPALMISDLEGPFAQASQLGDHPAPTVTLAGDAHLGNFGSVRGPDGQLVYALDDFDQSGKGPAEWDLDRLATSVVLQGRAQGLSDSQIDAAVKDLGNAYFGELGKFASSGKRPPSYLTASETQGPAASLLQDNASETRADLIKKDTTKGKHGLEFDSKKYDSVGDKTAKKVTKAFDAYAAALPDDAPIGRPPKILDIATKSDSGGSSFGMARYEVLVADQDPSQPPHIVELKEEMPAAVGNLSGDPSQADAAQDVANQKKLAGYLNPLTGSVSLGGQSFLAREIEPGASSFDVTTLKSATDLDQLATQAAVALARAHAQTMRSSDARAWIGKDPSTMVANLDAFAKSYADQTEADFKAFKKRN